jgi:hypothetical protein
MICFLLCDSYPKGIKYLSGGSYSKVYSAIEDNCRIVLKTQVLGERFRNGSNLRISKTKYLISDLINTQSINNFYRKSKPNKYFLTAFFIKSKKQIQNY